MSSNEKKPAILGGTPVRPEGPPGWPAQDPAVDAALERMIEDRSWGRYHGPHCQTLIEGIRAYQECEHALLCSSGTAAIELALRGLQVAPGDEVIVAAYDFKGNFQDVLAVGAVPVLVDVAEETWSFDPRQLAAAVSEKTRAVIVSHLHGAIVPMPGLMQAARDLGVTVIEDACQVPGALVHGRKAGNWGDVGVWSFGGSKLLTAGRGGALFTNDAALAQRVRLYSHRGNEAYPLSEMQAAVLVPQLAQLDRQNRVRAESVSRLRELLREESGLTRPESDAADDCEPAYYKVGRKYEPSAWNGLSRDRFAAAMRAEGIAIDAGFRGLHRIHSRRRFRSVGELTHASRADEDVLVLHHPMLLEDESAIAQFATALEKLRDCAAEIAEADM